MREKITKLLITLPGLLLLVCGLTLLSGSVCAEELIPVKIPDVGNRQMPQVFFPHDKHVEYLDGKNEDCSTCHNMTDDGMSEAFKNVSGVEAKKQTLYMHTACTDCHIKAEKGPRLVDCRICHSKTNAPGTDSKNK